MSVLCQSYKLGVTRDESLQYGASRPRRAAAVDQVNCKTVPVVGDRIHRIAMSSADIAACFPSEHDSGSFLIPALAWNLYYNSDERVKQMPKPIALGLQVPTVKVMNWVFILIILVLGLGLGGWASIKTMDEKVKEFELFDRCNGC